MEHLKECTYLCLFVWCRYKKLYRFWSLLKVIYGSMFVKLFMYHIDVTPMFCCSDESIVGQERKTKFTCSSQSWSCSAYPRLMCSSNIFVFQSQHASHVPSLSFKLVWVVRFETSSIHDPPFICVWRRIGIINWIIENWYSRW